MASSDLVATWEVPLPKGKYKIEFEHGTTSGKRVIRINNKEILHEPWMFKLVGKETFKIGDVGCVISIDAVQGFAYEYSLQVGGKSYAKFKQNQQKIQKAWKLSTGHTYRIVLEKGTLDVWVNGVKMNTSGDFGDDSDGTSIYFNFGPNPSEPTHSGVITATSSGKRKTGIIHTLYVDDQEIPECYE